MKEEGTARNPDRWVVGWVGGCVCGWVCVCVWGCVVCVWSLVAEWFALWALNRKVGSSSHSVGMMFRSFSIQQCDGFST